MSVVPLITEGPHRSVVQRQEDFSVNGRAILISGMNESSINNSNSSNVSYDLRVGKQYRNHRKKDPNDISDDGEIELKPGSALIIQTEEFVHFPRTLFGIIAPKVRLLEEGLSTTFSKIDPGYTGHLLITLFNLGQTVRKLKRGAPFCALTLLDVSEGARLYGKGPQQISARLEKQPRRTISEWLLPHHVTATILLILATSLLAAVTGYDVWERVHHNNHGPAPFPSKGIPSDGKP